MFCNITANHCVELASKTNLNCTDQPYSCGFSSFCHSGVCVDALALPIGAEIPSIEQISTCSTSNATMVNGTLRCTPLNIANQPSDKGFPLGTMCNYTSFPDPSNLKNTTTFSIPAKCGFGYNGFAYCQAGGNDPIFQEFFSAFKKFMVAGGSSKCPTTETQNLSELNCAAIQEFNRENFEIVNKAKLGVVPGTAFFQANSNCVANQITASWYQTMANSVFLTTMVSSLVGLIFVL